STAGVNQVRASTVEGSQADFESTGEAFKVDQLASAWGMGCGLVSGAVWCWNFSGPGDPPSRNPGWGQLSRAPTLVDDTHEFIDLAVMGGAVCALDIQHTVWCARSGEQSLVLQSGLPLMRSIASSPDGFGFLSDELCGLAEADSTAWCWVYGGAGVQLPRSPAFIKLWMDPGIACGLRVDSTAACWGSGPLGDGTTGASDTAVAVSGGHRFLELALGVAVGSAGACGRTTTREIWCWGSSGSSPDVLTPIFLESNSYGVGMTDNVIASYSFGQSMNQWWWLGATKSVMRVGRGLEDLPVKGFSTNNSPSCVHLVDRQVYCWDIMWDQTSRIPTETYSPVQPVRSLP
ncbi:MAG: hypothetical protein R2910_06100, partial [Gemmatimonadales bacterium]